MGEKDERGKVYQFTPRKGPKLKTMKYVAPEKKELLKERARAKMDKRNFYIGVGILLILVAVLTFFKLR